MQMILWSADGLAAIQARVDNSFMGLGDAMFKVAGFGENIVAETTPIQPVELLEKAYAIAAMKGWVDQQHSIDTEELNQHTTGFEGVDANIPIVDRPWNLSHVNDNDDGILDRLNTMKAGVAMTTQRYGGFFPVGKVGPLYRKVLDSGITVWASSDGGSIPWTWIYYMATGKTAGGKAGQPMESTGGKRRLATILAADVVGYSKLMAQDEEATVRILRSNREIIDKLIDRHEGRIFNTAGDAVLAEFGSAVEAVRCAISIQDELRVRNAELVADRQMLLRIGVNVGDVLVEGSDLLGDGVNIAARLEGIAAPGGVCISGSTFEQVKNKLSIGFEDLGPQQVKNIPEPIPAFAITTAPVSVKGDAATATANDTGQVTPRTPLIIAAAIAIVVAAGGIAYLQFSTRAPPEIASLPTNISIDEMRAGQIEALLIT